MEPEKLAKLRELAKVAKKTVIEPEPVEPRQSGSKIGRAKHSPVPVTPSETERVHEKLQKPLEGLRGTREAEDRMSELRRIIREDQETKSGRANRQSLGTREYGA